MTSSNTMEDQPIIWQPGEVEAIIERARQLSPVQLKELTELVGITFTHAKDTPLLKEEYLGVLDEANNKEKLLAYLTAQGV